MNIIKKKKGYKTTEAIEWSIKKLKIGNVIFSSFSFEESKRVFTLFCDNLCHNNVNFHFDKRRTSVNVFGNRIIFTQRNVEQFYGLKLHCAVIDNYDYSEKDEKFLYFIMPRLRKIKTLLPYYKNDYYPAEISIKILRR